MHLFACAPAVWFNAREHKQAFVLLVHILLFLHMTAMDIFLLLHLMSECNVMGNFTDGRPTPVNLFSNLKKN
jgi:hypothetical protein